MDGDELCCIWHVQREGGNEEVRGRRRRRRGRVEDGKCRESGWWKGRQLDPSGKKGREGRRG